MNPLAQALSAAIEKEAAMTDKSAAITFHEVALLNADGVQFGPTVLARFKNGVLDQDVNLGAAPYAGLITHLSVDGVKGPLMVARSIAAADEMVFHEGREVLSGENAAMTEDELNAWFRSRHSPSIWQRIYLRIARTFA